MICHHGNSMTSAHYTCISLKNKRVRCNDSKMYYDWWLCGAKDVYVIVPQQ